MKRILGVALFLCLASSTPAGPIEWAKHHKRFLLMEGAAVAAVPAMHGETANTE